LGLKLLFGCDHNHMTRKLSSQEIELCQLPKEFWRHPGLRDLHCDLSLAILNEFADADLKNLPVTLLNRAGGTQNLN
jgi:hypothetical protein